MLLNGEDVTAAIREPEVGEAASKAAASGGVRRAMVEEQRRIAATRSAVMEGRDIGTRVFPDAEVKIFLDAAPEVRGNRRFLQSPGPTAPEASVLAELRARDQRDRTRANSPLVAASDAILIDSTSLTLEQVVQRAMAIVDEKLARIGRGGS